MKQLKYLVTMALLLLATGVYADQVTVSAEKFNPGETFSVTVSLENTTNVAAYQMVLYLPEGFSINRYYDEDDEEWKDDCTLSPRHKSGHGLGITTQDDGGFLFLVYANPTKTLKSTPSELFTLKLKAASTVAVSKKASFKNVKITDENGTDTSLDDVTFDLTYDTPINIVQDEDGYTVTMDEENGGATGGGVIPSGILDANGSVTIATLSYTRELDAPSGDTGDATVDGTAAKLYTTCLPNVPATADNAKYYTLDGANNTTLTFVEVANSSLTANTPYLVAVKSGSALDESQNVTNVTLKREADNSTTKDGFMFKGTLTGLSNADAAAAGAYILQSGNVWGKVTTTNTNAYIPPFRAYIVATSASAPAIMNGTIGDDNTTGIQNIRTVDLDGTECWYDLNGKRIQKPTKGINIQNGRKVMMK